MTTNLGKSCSFGLPRVPFVNCRQFMYYFPFGFEGRVWDLIESVPDHCLSFYSVCVCFFVYIDPLFLFSIKKETSPHSLFLILDIFGLHLIYF